MTHQILHHCSSHEVIRLISKILCKTGKYSDHMSLQTNKRDMTTAEGTCLEARTEVSGDYIRLGKEQAPGVITTVINGGTVARDYHHNNNSYEDDDNSSNRGGRSCSSSIDRPNTLPCLRPHSFIFVPLDSSSMIQKLIHTTVCRFISHSLICCVRRPLHSQIHPSVFFSGCACQPSGPLLLPDSRLRGEVCETC